MNEARVRLLSWRLSLYDNVAAPPAVGLCEVTLPRGSDQSAEAPTWWKLHYIVPRSMRGRSLGQVAQWSPAGRGGASPPHDSERVGSVLCQCCDALLWFLLRSEERQPREIFLMVSVWNLKASLECVC